MCPIFHYTARELTCSRREHAQNIVEFRNFPLENIKLLIYICTDLPTKTNIINLKRTASKGTVKNTTVGEWIQQFQTQMFFKTQISFMPCCFSLESKRLSVYFVSDLFSCQTGTGIWTLLSKSQRPTNLEGDSQNQWWFLLVSLVLSKVIKGFDSQIIMILTDIFTNHINFYT